MSPLQRSVYLRLSLIFFFTPFLFFLDIFTAAIITATCHHGNNTGSAALNGTLLENAEGNRSKTGEGEADWRTENVSKDDLNDHFNAIFF